jgi:phosphatidylserine decarboxylase
MRTNLLPIAKEGVRYVVCAIALLVVFGILDFDFLESIAFFALIFFLFVFRNPEREIPSFQYDSVVAPADGTVKSIEELEDEVYAYKVEIDSNYFNVALLRAPIKSSVADVKLFRGAMLSKSSPLHVELNERAELSFKDSNDNTLKIVHRLKKSFKTIDIDLLKAQNVNQGSRYGLMLNGTTTLYLPKNFRLNVSVGAEVNAGESLVGYFTN